MNGNKRVGTRRGLLLSGLVAAALIGAPARMALSEQGSHGAPAHSSAAAASTQVTSDTPAAGLRVALNSLLAEHVYLAARAPSGALGGRQAEFAAAAAALDANSVDLSKAIGMAYGPEVEAAFLPLWRAHIGMVVDYTTGLATDDQARQDKAVGDLVQYSQDFGAFMSAANERLPKDVVAELVKLHVLTLKDVIDAQKAGDPTAQFSAIRTAGHHMGMIADPLAEATVKKFPEKFATSALDHATHAAPAAQAWMPTAAVDIRLFSFEAPSIQVPAGTTVAWTNHDAIEHSVTAADGAFDSGLFTQGGTFEFAFGSPGAYAYICSRHPSMQGVVEVEPA
jgi:plastocyanin